MRIRVKVTPGAKHQGVHIHKDLLTDAQIYLVKVRAKPVDGEANRAVVDVLAEYFDVPRRKVSIVKGEKGRLKVMEVGG